MSFKCLLALAVLTSAAAHAATPLPDACGSDKTRFDVKTDNAPQLPAAPDSGKAQIVFIETLHKASDVIGHPTVRFGLDGTWAGAAKGSSSFTVSVEPGEHHLCAAWQSHFKSAKDQPGTMPLTVEPGKTYFVGYTLDLISTGDLVQHEISFAQINDDEAKFFLKTYPVATWKTNP